MSKILSALSLVFALGIATDAHALTPALVPITLEYNSQCVGGTLIHEESDVIDGGGISSYLNAKQEAEPWCSQITPAGGCCSVRVRTNASGIGGPVVPYTTFNYKIYTGATVQTGYDPVQIGELANVSPWTQTTGSQIGYLAGIADTCLPTATNDQWYTTAETQVFLFGERLQNPYDCAYIAAGEGYKYWNQTTTVHPNEFDPADTICTGFQTITGTVSKPRVTYPLDEFGEYTKYRSGSTCPSIAITASLVANPPSIHSGEQSVLTWGSTGATTCTGTNFSTGGVPQGSLIVRPTATTPYSVLCTGTGGSAQAQTTVTVGTGLTASCRAHPRAAGIGDDVLWSSSVSAPGSGVLTYSWTGTDGLSGTASQLIKRYTTTGHKDAWLTVTYTPSATPTTCSAIGLAPVTPCAGTWTATYDQSECQSGWQCVVGDGSGGGGGSVGGAERPFYMRYWETLSSFLLFDRTDPQFMDPNYVETVKMIEGTVKGVSTYSYVKRGEPYFTKICTGGLYTENIQKPTCSGYPDFPSCAVSEEGEVCKVHPYDDLGCTTGPGIVPESGEPTPGPTLYGYVQNYICEAPGTPAPPPTGGTQSITVQCESGVDIDEGSGDGGSGGGGQCSDGIDNDRDGAIDESDPGCSTNGVYDPNDNSEAPPQCSDGIDNNRDGVADYPDDPGCDSASDNLEFIEPADLSLSVNPPLIKKNQQCTITLSARNVASCSLSGSGISKLFTAVLGVVTTKEVVTPGLQQTATYTLSCKGLDGKTATKKVDCKIAPTFEEI